MFTLYRIATIPKFVSISLNQKNIHKLDKNDDMAIRIRKLRKISGLTAEKLAELVGITGAGIIGYENNITYPSRNVLLKLKQYLGNELLCDDYSNFITMDYSSLLKMWRKNNKLSYCAASKFFGMSESSYYGFENMKYIISKNNFEKYKCNIENILLFNYFVKD